MDITTEERQELIQDVVNEITTQSTSIDELEEAESLSQLDSLPAYKTNSSELIKVPISLLSKPADDAAVTANAAASSANSAAALATASKEAADKATNAANTAAEAANTAAALTEQTKNRIDTIELTANSASNLSATLSGQLGNTKIVTTTEDTYEKLEEKDDNTLYFCVEEDT